MNNTQELTKGIFVSFRGIIKKLTIGAILSLIPTLIIRFIEISFGFSWENGIFFFLLSYGYLIITTIQSIYYNIKTYLKEGIYYIIGWTLGSIVLYRFSIITLNTFIDSIAIQVTIIVLRTIFKLLAPSKNKPLRKFKRHSP